MLKPLFAFLFVVSVAYAVHAFIKGAGVDFALGILFAVGLYQIAHKVTHGTWIEF